MPSRGCDGCQGDASLDFDFAMAFQPIIDLETQSVWGYEALVRGAAGQSAASVLAQVDDQNRYRFDQRCRVQAIETAGRLFPDPGLHLSINFMPNAVYEPAACIRTSLQAAAKVGFAHDRIMFEFTENEKLDVPKVARIVSEYKRFGFITALDDFGSGYAGLGLMAAFQPDLIKIDMDLVRDIDSDRPRQAIVAGVVGIARDLGITVLAEGVERAEEVAMLRSLGLSLFQGYYFAKPIVEALPPLARDCMAPAPEA
jgi:EAL domain-containing protein (putative c-di-GMP-specific phosphodiesterase class I)